jgi:hypothetical protein
MKPYTVLPVLLLAACALGHRSTPQADADARLYRAVPDKAVVYLIRDWGYLFAAEVKVTVDGKEIGETYPGSYFRWELPPGRHVIASLTDPPATLSITTAPGGIYYVWQDIHVGFLRPHTALRLVDQTTTRAVLDTAYLLQNKQ